VVFCNVDEDVLEVFRISKLGPMFTFAADRAAALALVANPAEGGPPPGGVDPPAKPPGPTAPASPPAPRADGPLRRNRRRD